MTRGARFAIVQATRRRIRRFPMSALCAGMSPVDTPFARVLRRGAEKFKHSFASNR
jgi:hypothetical protein